MGGRLQLYIYIYILIDPKRGIEENIVFVMKTKEHI